jgi:hypothetical protein
VYSAAVADYTMLTYSSETESPKPWDAKKFAEIKGPVRNFKRDGISHITHDHCSVFLAYFANCHFNCACFVFLA